ncbi:MAG TPA: helix-turn-helix transcriptional regulator [Flavobacteriales bacterium]|nr:helix-turn-helix transcriptional regulator [Flavobacteriales bacterium]
MEQPPHLPAHEAWHHVYHQLCALKQALDQLGLGAAAPTEPPPSLPPALRLSKRQRQFLKLLCDPKGYTYKEIAHRMNCHPSTLRTYRERIARQHGIAGKTNLLRWALQNGLD